MANVIAINETGIKPVLQISIAPLVKLKENFIATMDMVAIPKPAQDKFFETFEELFEMQASGFNLIDLYKDGATNKHWLAFDREDKIAPYPFLEEFLALHPDIIIKEYTGLGHERIIKDAGVVADIVKLVSAI
jgi:hypothetical protein